MAKHKTIKKRIFKFLISSFFVFFLVLVNKVCAYRPYYWFKTVINWGVFTHCGKVSPDNQYSIYVFQYHTWRPGIKVDISRWYYLWPRNILSYYGPKNPWNWPLEKGQLKWYFDVVWSKDGRYAVLVCQKWFVDLYDFEKDYALDDLILTDCRLSEQELKEVFAKQHNKIVEYLGAEVISDLQGSLGNGN